MINRRLFVSCAICATAALATEHANGQTPPLTRTILRTIDAPTPGYEIILAKVDAVPNAIVARHTHFGVESTVLLEGGGELLVDGQPNRLLKPGDSFQIPPGVIHALNNGPAPSVLSGTYIVEKGKPLATPA